MNPKPLDVVNLLSEHGAALTMVAFALPLLFFYFWREIQKKSTFERFLEAQNEILKSLAVKLDKIKDDVLELKIRMGGDFRIRGRNDDEQ